MLQEHADGQYLLSTRIKFKDLATSDVIHSHAPDQQQIRVDPIWVNFKKVR